MPKQVQEKDLNVILTVLARFPEGASIEAIRSVLEKKLPRRTVQRRIAHLTEQKRLKVEGR